MLRLTLDCVEGFSSNNAKLMSVESTNDPGANGETPS